MRKLGALLKARLRKKSLFWRFSGGALIFSGAPVLWNSSMEPFTGDKIADFYTNTAMIEILLERGRGVTERGTAPRTSQHFSALS